MTEYKDQTKKHFIHFWLRNTEKLFVMYFGMIVLFSFYQFFFSNMLTVEESIAQMPYMLLGGGAFVLGITAATVVKGAIPQAVSFGSTRKEAFWSNQLSIVIMLVQIVIVFIILRGILERGEELFTTELLFLCLLYIGVMFAAIGVGQLASIIMMKLGAKGASIFMILIIMLFAGGFGVVFALSRENFIGLFTSTAKITSISLSIGILLYLIGCFFNYKNVMKLSVNL